MNYTVCKYALCLSMNYSGKKINKHPIHCVRAMLVLQSSLVPPIESLQELGNGLMGLKL